MQGITCFRAKVGLSNESSLQLFGKLGYTEVSRSSIFQEATLELGMTSSAKLKMLEDIRSIQVEAYDT